VILENYFQDLTSISDCLPIRISKKLQYLEAHVFFFQLQTICFARCVFKKYALFNIESIFISLLLNAADYSPKGVLLLTNSY
jgi:hypothetical protein